MSEEIKLGDAEVDRERQSDGNGIETDGTGCRMDGATSGARRDSKRVETQPLAEVETGQHRQRNHTTAHVPQPSTPPPPYSRSPSDCMNPLQHRGRLKTKPRRVSRARSRRSTHQAIRSRQGRIGQIRAIGICFSWSGKVRRVFPSYEAQV